MASITGPSQVKEAYRTINSLERLPDDMPRLMTFQGEIHIFTELLVLDSLIKQTYTSLLQDIIEPIGNNRYRLSHTSFMKSSQLHLVDPDSTHESRYGSVEII